MAHEESKSFPLDAFPWLQIRQNCFYDRYGRPDSVVGFKGLLRQGEKG